MPALGGVGARLRSGGEFGCRPGNGGKLTDGREYFSPVSERDADVLEVLIGQMGECRDANPFFGWIQVFESSDRVTGSA